MDEVEYRRALAMLEQLRPTGLSSTLTALPWLLGPRRICRDLGRTMRRLADQLSRIDPPPDVAAEHYALIRAIRRAGSDLDELARRRGLRAFERFEAMGNLNLGEAELRALEAKGYRLPKSPVRRHC